MSSRSAREARTVHAVTPQVGDEPREMRALEPPGDWIFHLIVEAIGTAALLFFGISAIAHTGGENLVAIALAHGIAIAVMVAATGHISGGAFNPAVVVALLIARKVTPAKGAMYVVAQLAGAALGAVLAATLFPADALTKVGYGVPAIGQGFSATNALMAEIVTTFFLAYVIFGVAVDKRGPSTIASLMIGLTIVIDILATGGVSGAAMNPARWFGAAIVAGNFADAWIWWVGPIIGASIAAGLYFFGYLRGRDA